MIIVQRTGKTAAGDLAERQQKLELPIQLRRKSGFGINEVIGIAAGIIIAVVIVIPGLQGFAGSILQNLTTWWNNMAASIFSMH